MLKIKNKLFVLLGLIISASLYLWVEIQWSKCPEIDCSEQFIDHWLRTIKMGSLFLGVFFISFLFIPKSYFKKWLKYIFSWGFPLAVYLTYITTGSSSIPAYGKVDVVRFWGIFFAVVTVIFILVQLYLDWKKSKCRL